MMALSGSKIIEYCFMLFREMDGVVAVVAEDKESLDSLCGEKDDIENEVIRVKAEAAQKEEEKAKGEDSNYLNNIFVE